MFPKNMFFKILDRNSYKNYILNDNSLIEFYVNKGVINIMKKGFNNNLKYDSKINLQSNDNLEQDDENNIDDFM